ncbi:MAG: hypothetical protein R3B57_02450 [Phycisphaerales bacterium]
MQTGAGRLWLTLALASTPGLAADGGPLSISPNHSIVATHAKSEAGDTSAPHVEPPTPSLSIMPRLGEDRRTDEELASLYADRDASDADTSDGAPIPTLADRSFALVDEGDDTLVRMLRTERSPFELAPRLRIEFSRPTQLRDGGVSGDQSALGADRLAAFSDNRGDIDLYNIALRWDAFRPGPLTFSFIGGVQAVQADIVGQVREYDSSGNVVSTRLDDAYGIAAVPVFGGGIRWDVSDRFYISGAAQTQTIPDGASLLDVTAQTGLDLSPTVGLRAGYQYLRTTVQVQNLDASLSVSGVFARLEIAF